MKVSLQSPPHCRAAPIHLGGGHRHSSAITRGPPTPEGSGAGRERGVRLCHLSPPSSAGGHGPTVPFHSGLSRPGHPHPTARIRGGGGQSSAAVLGGRSPTGGSRTHIGVPHPPSSAKLMISKRRSSSGGSPRRGPSACSLRSARATATRGTAWAIRGRSRSRSPSSSCRLAASSSSRRSVPAPHDGHRSAAPHSTAAASSHGSAQRVAIEPTGRTGTERERRAAAARFGHLRTGADPQPPRHWTEHRPSRRAAAGAGDYRD